MRHVLLLIMTMVIFYQRIHKQVVIAIVKREYQIKMTSGFCYH